MRAAMSDGVSGVALRQAASRHPGFTTKRRISGFTVDCEECSWRAFTYVERDAEKLHAQHVAAEAARLEQSMRRYGW